MGDLTFKEWGDKLSPEKKAKINLLIKTFNLDWKNATITRLKPEDWPGATEKDLAEGLVIRQNEPAKKLRWDEMPWPPCKFSVGDKVKTSYQKTRSKEIRTVENVYRSMDAIQTGYLVKVTGIGKEIEAAWLTGADELPAPVKEAAPTLSLF